MWAGRRHESVVAINKGRYRQRRRSSLIDSVIYEHRKRMSESWLHSTNIILWTACIGLGAGAYAGRLPARMGLLPMFALVPVVLHCGAAWWVQYAPGSLNMPNQAVYDALSDEDQQRVVACTLPYSLLCRRRQFSVEPGVKSALAASSSRGIQIEGFKRATIRWSRLCRESER